MRKVLIAVAVVCATVLAGCCKKAEPCNECACQALDCGSECNYIEIAGWECK